MEYPVIWPQYFTATIHKWNHLLKDDSCKDIIIDSLRFMAKDRRVEVSAFVIMSNHIHLIWQPLQQYRLIDIQTSFLTHTAKALKNKLLKEDVELIQKHLVNKHDRTYQVWKRESLSIELFTEATFMQKLEYIHQNPVAAGLVQFPEDYYYSSAKFYELGIDEFNLLTHFSGN